MSECSPLSNLLRCLILMLSTLMLTITVLLILVLLILMIVVFELLFKGILLCLIGSKFVVCIDIEFRILRKVDGKSIFNNKYFLDIRIKFMSELRDKVLVRLVEFRCILRKNSMICGAF